MLHVAKNMHIFRYTQLPSLERYFYYRQISHFLSELAWEYPNFYTWYEKLFQEDKTLQEEREILLCLAGNVIAGVAILKRTAEEQKICTLRVGEVFQHQGIGKKLMELSLEWLENDKPLMTLHKRKQREFSPLLRYYGFALEQKKWSYYHIFSTELVYNGELPGKKILLGYLESADITKIFHDFCKAGHRDWQAFYERYLYQRRRDPEWEKNVKIGY